MEPEGTMTEVFKPYRDESRKNWGRTLPQNQTISEDDIKLGAILRIADAAEAMAKNHVALQNDRDYLARRVRELDAVCARLSRSNAGLRGVIKRMKRQAGENAEVVQKLVAEADSAPFTTVGNFVEHVAQIARVAAVKRTAK